jgi:hypothetical protein
MDHHPGLDDSAISILAGIVVILAVLAVLVMMIPSTEDPLNPIGPKITLWRNWERHRSIGRLIRDGQADNAMQKAAVEKHGTVCFDP